MRMVTVSSNEAGQRLDKFLGKYLNMAGKGFIYKMLRKKNITLNGKKCGGSEKLVLGDEIRLFLSDETLEKFSQVRLTRVKKVRLDIVYEDEHILLINKPSGMLSQKAGETDESLVEYLTGYLLDSGQLRPGELKTFHPSVCNRLDRNTSGLVAAGKSLAGLQLLSEIFKDRSIHKYYQCIVSGDIQEKKEISGYLTKDERSNRVSISPTSSKGALPIRTLYQPISSNGRYTLLSVALITGRSHQIRAHLASMGHPIVGDGKYGSRQANEQAKRQYGIRSQLLHSHRMVFPPMRSPLEYLSGREFTAPLPEAFERMRRGEGLGE